MKICSVCKRVTSACTGLVASVASFLLARLVVNSVRTFHYNSTSSFLELKCSYSYEVMYCKPNCCTSVVAISVLLIKRTD